MNLVALYWAMLLLEGADGTIFRGAYCPADGRLQLEDYPEPGSLVFLWPEREFERGLIERPYPLLQPIGECLPRFRPFLQKAGLLYHGSAEPLADVSPNATDPLGGAQRLPFLQSFRPPLPMLLGS